MLQWGAWAIRVWLENAEKIRELASFNLAIDSKLRGGDLVRLKVAVVYAAGQVKHRASIVQSKTRKPVSFEITEGTRKAVAAEGPEPTFVGTIIAKVQLLQCSQSRHRAAWPCNWRGQLCGQSVNL